MNHCDILSKFKEIAKIEMDEIEFWYPNGFYSITVRLKNQEEFVLTYHSPTKWRIETVDSFIESVGTF